MNKLQVHQQILGDEETMSHSSWLHSVACELCTSFPTHLPHAFHCLPYLYRGAHLITHTRKLGFILDPPSISLRRTNQSPSSTISNVPPLCPAGSHPDTGVYCLSLGLFPDSPSVIWIFTERTNAKAEAPILRPLDVKSRLVGKDPDAGKDWREEEKGMAEDEMVGWHHQLNGHGANSRRWWRTGTPGVLWSIRSQSQTWLSYWTITTNWSCLSYFLFYPL